MQHFGHLTRSTDSLEQTLMLGKVEGGRRRGQQEWGGWMAPPMQWTWVWVGSGSWWWTGKPGVLQSMGSQRVGHDWETELNWAVKNPRASAGYIRDSGSIPGSGRSPGEGHSNSLQYSCLEESTWTEEPWQAAVHRVTKSQTRLKRLSTQHTRANQWTSKITNDDDRPYRISLGESLKK